MSRQIILDTETTGLRPTDGHRIIEIGCIEMVNRRLTGEHFHCYLNPNRIIDPGAVAVHGITNEFLLDKPDFADIVEEFLAFIKGAELIIHNAPFDVGFINHELTLHKKKLGKIEDFCQILDTLPLARQRHPGQKNNLDALCKRYKVDNSKRDVHGALLDAQLLARVYLAMTGGQGSLFTDIIQDNFDNGDARAHNAAAMLEKLPLLVQVASSEEVSLHEQWLAKMKAKNGGVCVWGELE
jgi:DNA polymerase III subunit epsilon